MRSVSDTTRRMVEALDKTSFKASDEPVYPLASGILSKYYIDCRMALSYPEFRQLIGDLFFEKAQSLPVDATGGMALSAYPIAVAVSDAFSRNIGKTVRAFVVRKEPKQHGLKKHIEGDVRPGDKVLIVDDVITTGGSTVDAIKKSREEGLEVLGAIAIIDRQECDGAANIEDCGVTFQALTTLQELAIYRRLRA